MIAVPLTIQQITTPAQLALYGEGISALLESFRELLADDFTGPDMLANTATCLPWLWVIHSEKVEILGTACLSDVIAEHHAYLHGATHPAIRRHPVITQLAGIIFKTAFTELQLLKLKAEFDADNHGALGFCRRFGFTREAYFRNDTRKQGRLCDVVLYSRFSPHTHMISHLISERSFSCQSDARKASPNPR